MLDFSSIAFSTLDFKSGASLTHTSSDTSFPLPNPDTILDYVQHQHPNRMSDYHLMVKVRGVYCLLQNFSINQGLVRKVHVTVVSELTDFLGLPWRAGRLGNTRGHQGRWVQGYAVPRNSTEDTVMQLKTRETLGKCRGDWEDWEDAGDYQEDAGNTGKMQKMHGKHRGCREGTAMKRESTAMKREAWQQRGNILKARRWLRWIAWWFIYCS